MNAKQLRTLFAILHNTGRSELEEAGLIWGGGNGNKDWTRFNDNLTTFVLKLSDVRLEALVGLLKKEGLE